MAAASIVTLTPKSQAAFLAYYSNVQDLQNISRGDTRVRYEHIDRTYQRELNLSEEQQRAKAANKSGDVTRFQDMIVPVVMPQVEAAVTHQTSVFLTGDSLFGTVADPIYMNEALQLETLLENDSIRGGWQRELMLFFRDGFKYNFAPLEVTWGQEITHEVKTNLESTANSAELKQVLWSGNVVRRLDPYNTFVDTRVSPSEVYKKGEFAGYTELMSRIRLKQFISELPDKIVANIAPAFASGTTTSGSAGMDSTAQGFYTPNINFSVTPPETALGGMNWMTWAGMSSMRNPNMEYKDAYEVTTLYARVLPSEFELSIPNKNTPQIYKLIIVNHQWIVYAELQTNAHNYLPILIGMPLEDGLNYQTKSLATNGTPFQELASAFMASIIASRRRAISDRVLYDPSRIAKAHIDSPNPSAKIPVRPKAYGERIADAVYHFPYNEDQQSNSMGNIQNIVALGNQLTGQNPVSQGQFVKGNKTNDQFDVVMSNATGRDQMAAILMETQVFTPMKAILKLNILQYQGGTTLYNRDKQKMVEVDPIQLRKAVLNFRVTDGLISKEQILNSEAFSTALQVIGSSPQISGGYNIAPLFSYIMKTQGADLKAFEKSPEQQAYEQALGQWQQMAQAAIDKGMEVESTLPPQPLPEQYGYDPKAQNPAPGNPAQEGEA